MSETATCRERLGRFCLGVGVDLGAGGDPINNTAICIDRDESDLRRSHVGQARTHIVCDVFERLPFEIGCLDYIFSSHCLEDSLTPAITLMTWAGYLKPEGHLVLFLPDQQAYLRCCEKDGIQPNQAHVFSDFSLDFVKRILPENLEVVHELFPVPNNPYSFDLVCKKKPI